MDSSSASTTASSDGQVPWWENDWAVEALGSPRKPSNSSAAASGPPALSESTPGPSAPSASPPVGAAAAGSAHATAERRASAGIAVSRSFQHALSPMQFASVANGRRADIPISLSLDAYRVRHPGDDLALAAFPSSLLLASSRGLPIIGEEPLLPSVDARSDWVRQSATGDYILQTDSPRTGVGRHIPPSVSGINRAGGISLVQAGMHKVRGNLGPGALALPGVFAKVGPVVGVVGLLIVCVPGICGLIVLVRLKRALNAAGKPTGTFEDIAEHAFGPRGRVLLETCIVCLQLGVAVVYFGVLAEAACAVPWLPCEASGAPMPVTVAAVAAAVLPCAFITRISSLLPLSLPGNLAILAAIVGSVVQASAVLSAHPPVAPPNATAVSAEAPLLWPTDWLQGIALVLPIENSLSAHASRPLRRFGYESLVVTAMSAVVSIFLVIGMVCGRAFPHASGSVVAYLAVAYPNSGVLQLLNGAVAAAVLCSFPLQLAPAMPTLERACCGDKSTHTYPLRTAIVAGCACVILAMPDVQMLVALTGALTTTTIGAFPFAMQLKLASAGTIPPLRPAALLLAGWVILFNAMVMCLGTVTAVRNIVDKLSG